MKFKLDPTKLLVLLLGLLSGIGTFLNFGSPILLHLVATLGFALVLYWAYSYFSSKHKSLWDTVITALIIFLVLHYGTGADLWYPLVTTFIAITWKFFFEYRGSPIVNPAAGAMLVSAALLPLISPLELPFISWWGTSFAAPLSLLLILPWTIYGSYKWRKLPLVLTFLVAHFLVMVFRGSDFSEIEFTFLDSTIYFLASVMLLEPRTSPVKTQQQIYYALFAALFYNIFLQYGVIYFGLFAIVAANLANVLLRPKLKKKA